MAKLLEKQKAVELRKKGFSYNEIRLVLKVSKSTLSLWLRSIGLAKRQARRLTEKQRVSQRNAVEKWHQIKVDRTLKIKETAAAEVGPLSERERWLVGVALYWAEGAKEHSKGVPLRFSNSDPNMVDFFRQWLFDFFKVSQDNIRYELYIHERSSQIDSAISFWTSRLKINKSKLLVRFKKHNRSPKRKNIGKDYKGLIRIGVLKSIDMTRKIDGWAKGIH